MLGINSRKALGMILIVFLSSLLLSACSLDDISNTIGGCCGSAAVPLAAMVLVFSSQGRKGI